MSQSHPGHNEVETCRLWDLGSPQQHHSHCTSYTPGRGGTAPLQGWKGMGTAGTGPPPSPVPGHFPECASLFDLQVEISGPGSELEGVSSDKGSQAAFQAPGASRDLPFIV